MNPAHLGPGDAIVLIQDDRSRTAPVFVMHGLRQLQRVDARHVTSERIVSLRSGDLVAIDVTWRGRAQARLFRFTAAGVRYAMSGHLDRVYSARQLKLLKTEKTQ